MRTNRELVEKNLREVLDKLKHSRRTVEKIKAELLKNKIRPGDGQKMINGETPLNELDSRELCLLLIQAYTITREENISYEIHYTEAEIKAAKTYQKQYDDDSIKFPYTFHNVNMINFDDFSCTISAQEIKKFMDSKLINYNFDTQREARERKDFKDPDNIVQTPKTNEAAVANIARLIASGELISSTLTLNARQMSSLTGEELMYDPKERTLTITEGTMLDILDGFHRVQGICRCLSTPGNEDIDMTFRLNVMNYDIKKAQNYFYQHNLATPVSHGRMKEMNHESQTSFIISVLQTNSELKGRITKSDHTGNSEQKYVTYNLLHEAIEDEFNAQNKIEAMKYAKFLTKFFDALILNNPEEFITDIPATKKVSLKNASSMFYGYVILAKRFYDNSIEIGKLQSIIESIDFRRETWSELGILNDDGRINGKLKKAIKTRFADIKLDEVISNVS